MINEERPPIPAELRRRVLIEAGHRCAIPTCRHIDVDVHHIVPWEQCKKHGYENLIALCPNCHRRANKGEIDRKSLFIYKANLRFAIEKYSQFEIDVLFELSRIGPSKGLPFPIYLNLLIKRLLDAGFVKIIETKWERSSNGDLKYVADLGDFVQDDENSGMWLEPVKTNPDFLVITEKGQEFVKSLSIEDIGY